MLRTSLTPQQERKIAQEKSCQNISQHSCDSTKQSTDKNGRAHFCLSSFSEDSVKALKSHKAFDFIFYFESDTGAALATAKPQT